VLKPSGKLGRTAFSDAFSIRATMAGVAKTSTNPEPYFDATLSAATTSDAVYSRPIDKLNSIPLTFSTFYDKGSCFDLFYGYK
jgi:hypothetical protein